jgi:hypothetical protein
MKRLNPAWWLRLWWRQIRWAYGCDPQTTSDRITARGPSSGWPKQ